MTVTGKERTVTVIVCSVEIARQPGEVFSYVTDPAHFGEWQAGVVDGHIEPAGPVEVGSRCVMTRRLGGADRTSRSVITELSPPRTWAIHGIDGPIRADVNVQVEPREDGKCTGVTIRIEFTGHGLGKVILPMVNRQARKEAPQNSQSLKQRMESGMASGPER
jgi:uncharacterized protein YndB with AHSA1/START domain